jgi:hypothetical protein
VRKRQGCGQLPGRESCVETRRRLAIILGRPPGARVVLWGLRANSRHLLYARVTLRAATAQSAAALYSLPPRSPRQSQHYNS